MAATQYLLLTTGLDRTITMTGSRWGQLYATFVAATHYPYCGELDQLITLGEGSKKLNL